MIPILTLMVILVTSILITRVATVALTLTGIPRETARFQARSAFTGVGFTTSESERIVNHPVRRRIVMTLMLLGNAGIVTAMSSLILTFVDGGRASSVQVGVLVAGLLALWAAARSQWLDRRLSRLIGHFLKEYTDLPARDVAKLLHLAGEYGVSELHVTSGDWLAGQTLEEAAVRSEGVLVLGITREDGTYIGAPRGSTRIFAGDNLIVYARVPVLAKLDERAHGWGGDVEHEQAVIEQDELAESETSRPASIEGEVRTHAGAR